MKERFIGYAFVAALALGGLSACSDGGRTGAISDPEIREPGPKLDVAGDEYDFAGYKPEISGDGQLQCNEYPLPFGCPCQQNSDCEAGYCIEGADGYFCTEECFEDCPEGWFCKGVSGFGVDLIFLCVPNSKKLCYPCTNDGQCGAGGRCVEMAGGGYCSFACDEKNFCPTHYSCIDLVGEDATFCTPDSGSCECTPKNQGEIRPCTLTNDFGSCMGFESCDATTGWQDCNAPDPALEDCDGLDNDCDGEFDEGLPIGEECEKVAEGIGTCTGVNLCLGAQGWHCTALTPKNEICDFLDNNCDGEVDEGFSAGEKYFTDEHCGTCNAPCFEAIPNASGKCDADFDFPKCVVDQCAEGYFAISPFQCIVPPDTTCLPCENEVDCQGASCVELDGVKRCAGSCETDEDCGSEMECLEYEELGTICQPLTGSCECNSYTDGGKRSCSSTNEIGTCYGFQTCDAESGWSDCDVFEPSLEDCNGLDDDCNGLIDDGLEVAAPCSKSNDFGTCDGQAVCMGPLGWVCQAQLPAEEACDYLDNDCDGFVDEDFTDDAGKYDSPAHCGSCTTSCLAGFPNAVTVCDAAKETPQCVVSECDKGYFKLNEFQCIPSTASICEPCVTDDNCLLNGARCVELSDGNFCSKLCTGNGDCPTGYTCQDYDDDKQCIPNTDSCTCDGTNLSLSKSCSMTWPVEPQEEELFITCYGLQLCEESGWSECALPTELCDGLDNDCNGVVDDGFLVEGKYLDDADCGQCGNNCTFLAYPHASGKCDVAQTVPNCAIECEDDYHDINGNPADGCECHWVSIEDEPDGIDQNCDGVDGDIENSIFVAKDGSDDNPGTMEEPMLTVQAALDTAKAAPKRDVYVATGVYTGSIVLQAGVRLYGGYSSDFLQRAPVLYETVIMGSGFAVEKPGTVNGFSVADDPGSTVVDGFTIYGKNNNEAGGSSYGVYLHSCGEALVLRNNHVVAGSGGNGLVGEPGGEGDNGVPGLPGTMAYLVPSNCDGGVQHEGGLGGEKSCGIEDVSGGKGGDSYCPKYNEVPLAEENGQAGAGPAEGVGGEAGWDGKFYAGSDGTCTCIIPPGDHSFEGADGAAGTGGEWGAGGDGCGSAGAVLDGLWQVADGLAGATGVSGSGGGGGGAGGGADSSVGPCVWDHVGATGGGGGSGGCEGQGGQGGGGGGGSFAVFLYFPEVPGTVPALQDNVLEGGFGGSGATGGVGGGAGAGGMGALGGAPGGDDAWCGWGGATGGDGGLGGHGGGGGGGCGGVAYCVFSHGHGNQDINSYQDNLCIPGAGGLGGSGGPSAGLSGTNGANGVASNVNF